MHNNFDLKHIRGHFGMTQSEMAQTLEVSQSTINSYESNPGSMPMDKFILLSQKLHIPIEDLAKGYIPENKSKLEFKIDDNLVDTRNVFVETLIETLNELQQIEGETGKYSEFLDSYEQANNVLTNTQIIIDKPNVAFLGKSDSGKSAMINTILGSEITPTHYQPATSSIIKIIHEDSKPNYMSENQNTLIFKTSFKEGSVLDHQIHDETFVDSHLIDRGDYSMISNYGLSKNFGDDEDDSIISIFAFNNANILKLINILDTPGISTGEHAQGEKDTKASEHARAMADIFVYLSVSNQFMHTEDHSYLRAIIENSTINEEDPFENLFIVASQAYIINDPEELAKDDGILDTGAIRFFKTLPQNFIEKRGENFTVRSLRDRIFSFSKGNYDLSIDFSEALISRIEEATINNLEKGTTYYKEAKSEYFRIQDKKIENLTQQIENEKSRVVQYESLKAQEEQIIGGIDGTLDYAKEKIPFYSTKSRSEFKKEYNKIINEDYIINLIKEKKFRNKKRDKEELATLISNTLGESFKEILIKYSEEFNENIYNKIEKIQVNVSNISFDVQRSFVSILAGGLAGGALTAYMSTLGSLGGYILVTKIVGWLSAIGISVGGGAVATTFISAIGGPITLSIALAALVSGVVYSIFGGGWKKAIVKELKKQYEKEDVLGQYLHESTKHWKDTKVSIEKTLKETKNQYYQRLTELENITEEDTNYFEETQKLIKSLVNILKKEETVNNA